MDKRRIVMAIMAAVSHFAVAGNIADYQVVPMPSSILLEKGKPFILDKDVTIYYEGGECMKRNAEFLASYVEECTGIQLAVTNRKSKSHQIQLGLVSSCSSWQSQAAEPSDVSTESYRMTVRENSVTIEGNAESGVFYGIQTLRKSLPARDGHFTPFQQVELPAVTIEDVPRFAYRGMHLDCARHFFSVDFVKRFIDMLAFHNMNMFHWHLTDDQGWRLEIKKHPELTSIGSKRSGTVIGNNSDVDDGIPYSGYYTQREVQEIVDYARAHYIKVIPEIDVPGHAMAVLAAHPELGCTGGPYQVGHKWGVYNDVLCVGNPETYELVKDVLDEVMEIFPSEVIHIGGDETPTIRWEQCPKCNALPLEGISYQNYFTRQITDYLTAKGRRAICWDESLEKGVSRNTIIMSWRGMKPGVQAAEASHDVVMTPLTHCYFDYYQTENKNYEPSVTGMWAIDAEKVYGLEPVPDSLSVEARNHIVGVQANIWTEQIASPNVVEYMALPRMAALAEVAWSAESRKNYEDFIKRITRLSEFYDAFGWTYAKHLWPERMTKDRWHIDN